jgi:hypothetical protein
MIDLRELHIEPENGLLSVERLSIANGQIMSQPVLPALSLSEYCAVTGLRNVDTTPTYYQGGEVAADDFTLLRWTFSDHVVCYGIAYKRMVARIDPTPSPEKQAAYLMGSRTVIKDELEAYRTNWTVFPKNQPNTPRQQIMDELLESL